MDAARFYDALASTYHLVYPNWDDAIQRQSDAISKHLGLPEPAASVRILDCACGIGTQTIGLAERGYIVTGCDVSRSAIARARREVRRRRLTNVHLMVADMRYLPADFAGRFHAVICCDNPLAHLLDPDDLAAAFRSMYASLRSDGHLLITSRDYDRLLNEKPSQMPVRRSIQHHRTTLVFQLWNWQADGHTYSCEHFVMQRRPAGWRVHYSVTTMKAYTRSEISNAARAVGFVDILWRQHPKTEYFQPVMTAVRRN